MRMYRVIVIEPNWTQHKSRVEYADLVTFEEAEKLARKLYDDDLDTAQECWGEDFKDQMTFDEYVNDYGGDGWRSYRYIIEAYEDGSLTDPDDVLSGGTEEVRCWRFGELDWMALKPRG